MTLHKLLTDRNDNAGAMGVQVTLTHELSDIGDAILRTRAIQAFDHAAKCYPIHRVVRCAVRRKLAPGVRRSRAADGLRRRNASTPARCCSTGRDCSFTARGTARATTCRAGSASGPTRSRAAKKCAQRILRVVGDQRLRDQMFVVDWQFCNARGVLLSTSFDEIADDSLLDEAYPSLGMPIADFIDRFLDARETVLILQGPPGGGKTRLVRAVLAAMSKRKGDSAKVMYTADKKALENDEIFVDFITGSHDAFVIEDADHLLKARTSGNFELHRFLGIADGVVRAQSRKVIFTTNLPNINDIDDALLRPGRCFAVKNLRSLEIAEAQRLARRICGEDEARHARAISAIGRGGWKIALSRAGLSFLPGLEV